MSDIIQEIIFPNSGLNTDDDERFIDLGSSPWRLNILISEDGASGVITNAKGNRRAVNIADHQLTLSNSYTTVASYHNRLTRIVYYFVYSQPYDTGVSLDFEDFRYDNKLFAYNEDTGNLDLIFTDQYNYFGFSADVIVNDLGMLGDWLYFNTKVSEPKMVDVVRAYNFTNYSAYDPALTYVYGNTITFRGGLFVANQAIGAGQSPSTHTIKWDRTGDSYRDETELNFQSEFDYAFDVLRMPPTARPIISYGSDTNINVNNVRGKIFRFSYRYKYFDNTYSAYSAFSDVTLPEDDEVYNGEIINDITTNNYILVRISPHSPALVKDIEIVFQEISGNWKRIKVVNRQEQAFIDTFEYSFNFYNNESYITVDNLEVAKIIDLVPPRANSQEIINKNILCYGGCLEGFDNIPKDEIRVTLTPVLENISIPETKGATRRNNVTSGDITRIIDRTVSPVTVRMVIDLAPLFGLGTLVGGDNYFVTIDGVTNSFKFGGGDVGSLAAVVSTVTTFIKGIYTFYKVNNDDGGGNIDIWSPIGYAGTADISQSLFCASGTTQAELTKKRGFKTGANQPFCIFYYDDSMRRWDAQTSKENVHTFGLTMEGTTVYVPMFNELVTPFPTSTAYKFNIDWEVYHLPPEGAKYWRWGFAGNSLCDDMVQYIVSDVTDSDPLVDGVNMVKIDITPLQTLKSTITADWNQFPMSVIDAYVWKKGDRIRFITEKVTPSSGSDLGAIIDGVFDFEIIKQDDTTNTIFIHGSLTELDLDTANVGVNTLVEIYTPLKSLTDTKTIYNEFGDLMPIIEDSGGIMVHSGQNGLHNQDTVLSHTAMGTFNGGDVYHIMRTPSKPLDTVTTYKGAFHESMWYSDFYDSADYDRGKIGFETNFGQRFLNIVRYSRPFFQNTQINGLSTFEEDPANGWYGFKELNDIYGDIVAILEMGDTLKVYQKKKASSILVGRTEYTDASGQTNVAISTSVLGAIRYSPSNYSTIFPESISRNNKYLYGFDIFNGVVWRDSVNGLFPISGRYTEVGGDSDYKMQTYFKLKAKALMHSGLEFIKIVSVWDEEFKNLYVTFKDSVVEANNDTVVFHEASNRWICFTEFNQTPEAGYITPLEPIYNITKGFPNGLGYSFDELTRFSHFSFNTPDVPVVIDPTDVFIVDEDGTTYIVDEDNTTSIIE